MGRDGEMNDALAPDQLAVLDLDHQRLAAITAGRADDGVFANSRSHAERIPNADAPIRLFRSFNAKAGSAELTITGARSLRSHAN